MFINIQYLLTPRLVSQFLTLLRVSFSRLAMFEDSFKTFLVQRAFLIEKLSQKIQGETLFMIYKFSFSINNANKALNFPLSFVLRLIKQKSNSVLNFVGGHLPIFFRSSDRRVVFVMWTAWLTHRFREKMRKCSTKRDSRICNLSLARVYVPQIYLKFFVSVCNWLAYVKVFSFCSGWIVSWATEFFWLE